MNEAIPDNGSANLRKSNWDKIIGDDFIEYAFQYAHEADPDAGLQYNDYNIETGDKFQKALWLLKKLKSDHIPITSFGIQGHWLLDRVPFKDLENAIVAFSALELKVNITELDIDVLPRRVAGGEQTVRLPDSFWHYDPLENKDIPVNSLPALEAGVVTFGWLNAFRKINDSTLALWAKIMRQVEGSRLLLLAPDGSARQRTLDLLRREGIDSSRIEFSPRQSRRKYLELYHRVDVGLDSFPYNGHSTSLDSFWMGVPVITLVGRTAVSRAGWCQLSNLGLGDLAGTTPEDFVRIAVELAKNLPRLAELRSTLRWRMEHSPLMDAQRFTHNIEAAYCQMWHTWCETAIRNM